ncbi:MAG: hypothetical protein U9P50_03085 [Patescibacteria group bacterium]|nr:hypothetical protein [Patescibacteria group bacterium]
MNLEIKITKREIKVGMALILVSALMVFAVKSALYFELQYENSLFVREEILKSDVSKEINPFDELSLSSKSFFVWDMRDNRKLGGLNEEMQFPLASLTKLMTVLVASELSTPDTIVKVKDSDLMAEGDSGLIAGEKWHFIEMINFVLLTSSNDGAQALASVISAFDSNLNNKSERELFVDKMNEKVKKLGLKQTFFLNETGLDINSTMSGAYGSAKDVAILVDNIMQDYPELLNMSSYKQAEVNSNFLTHRIDNTNVNVEELPGVVASKTGFTDLAGGNLMVVFDAGINHKIVVSVLGSTKEERFTDVNRLVWASLEKIFNENQKI